MPSMSTAKKYSSVSNTVGQTHKQNADFIMEETWDNDIQSKKAYIYDYYHDDQPSLKSHMTYENTTKTKIDVKFIVSTYGSLAKDQVEYHIMFKPSQKTEFERGDELYYFETDYRQRYGNDNFIGLFLDIPNEKGVYEKWMICARDGGNQFPKYFILPVNYYLTWVEWNNNERIIRKMWAVRRSQNSYNSGLWSSYNTTTIENQSKIWLPLNPITEKLSYKWNINGTSFNQRIVMSALIEHPNVWKISKIENAQPFGIQMLTLYQDQWNPNTDYIDWENKEMYADYNLSLVNPTTSQIDKPTMYGIAKITASTDKIKLGGSYKLLTVTYTDRDGQDITDKYIDDITSTSWTCSIDGTDYTSNTAITWLTQTDNNKIKIKIADNPALISKILTVKCTVNTVVGEIQLQLS